MKQPMKDRVERFVVLPFDIGCTSELSVAVGSSSNQQSKKPKSEPKAYSETTGSERAKSVPNGDHHNHDQRPRSSLPNFLYGLQKLVAGSFKSFSQIFVYRDELKEVEIEMQIGFPTDVKHVTHIGLDGSTTTNPVKGWDNLAMSMAPEILTFPSLSLRQFELAMAAQSAADDHINAPRPVTVDPAKFSRNTTARSS